MVLVPVRTARLDLSQLLPSRLWLESASTGERRDPSRPPERGPKLKNMRWSPRHLPSSAWKPGAGVVL